MKPVLLNGAESVRELLGCELDRVEVDLRAHIAQLYLPSYNCTDMRGAIALITAIDPQARVIRTIAGTEPDTTYRRCNGEWRALDQRGRQ